jgi:hypothetical protein
MKNISELDLMLFEVSLDGALSVLPYGISNFMLDWEFIGKHERQDGYDTEIAPVDVHLLSAIARIPETQTWCRINRYGSYTVNEIELAIDAGVNGIYLPMVTSPMEVEYFLRHVNGRSEVGILVETQAALDCIKDLSNFALDRVYFGLNDFAISRGGGSIFRALLDGSVECAREAFGETKFGFGGITAVDAGLPVPCVYLIEEMERLDCQFSFLRRTYRADVTRVGASELINGVQSYWQKCLARNDGEVKHDRYMLERLLNVVCSNA